MGGRPLGSEIGGRPPVGGGIGRERPVGGRWHSGFYDRGQNYLRGGRQWGSHTGWQPPDKPMDAAPRKGPGGCYL